MSFVIALTLSDHSGSQGDLTCGGPSSWLQSGPPPSTVEGSWIRRTPQDLSINLKSLPSQCDSLCPNQDPKAESLGPPETSELRRESFFARLRRPRLRLRGHQRFTERFRIPPWLPCGCMRKAHCGLRCLRQLLHESRLQRKD